MIACATCGQENPDVARFCLACGTELTGAPAGQDERRVVSGRRLGVPPLSGATAGPVAAPAEEEVVV